MNARGHQRARRRSGFTLLELMVSVAILLAVLALIGTIFSTVSKAGGNATSMSTMHRHLGQVADVLQEDLARTEPSTGMLAIAGEIIAAHATVLDRTNGRPRLPHRADALMVFTQRDPEPYVYQHDPNVAPPLAPVVQVTYAHANFGKFKLINNSWTIDTTTGAIKEIATPQAGIAASEWHLARRVICFFDATYEPINLPPPDNFGVGPWPLTDRGYLTGEAEVLGQYRWERIRTQYLSTALLSFVGNTGTSFFFNDGIADYLTIASNARYLFTNYWFALAGSTWQREERPTGGPVYFTESVVPQAYAPAIPTELFAARSIIDPKPPLDVARPMTSNFLDNCSEFKVEYTYDDPRELRLNTNGTINPSLPVRWQSVPNGQRIIWSSLPVLPDDRTDPRRWPRALRITLKAWDPGGRLTEPVTRTIVHTW